VAIIDEMKPKKKKAGDLSVQDTTISEAPKKKKKKTETS
jgi:hypothetical protein